MRARMHQAIPRTGAWLAQVVSGFYHTTQCRPMSRALEVFRHHVLNAGGKRSASRSQREKLTWARTIKLAADFSPTAASFIHGPSIASPSAPEAGAVCLNGARRYLCGGRGATHVPTASAPGMGIDLEVKVLPQADHSERSKPQSVDPRGRREGSGGEAAGRRTGTGYEAAPSRASGLASAKLS